MDPLIKSQLLKGATSYEGEIPSGSVGHHVNILHVFLHVGTFHVHAAFCREPPFGISAEMTKELIYWAFRWWAL